MFLSAGMAELADAADLKSAGLKKLVGVRVPLSAPALENIPSAARNPFFSRWSIGKYSRDLSTPLRFAQDFACGLPPARRDHARKTAQLRDFSVRRPGCGWSSKPRFDSAFASRGY